MRLLGGEQLGGQVALGGAVGVVVGRAALAGAAVLEVRVGGEEALVVGWAAEGFLALGLRRGRVLEGLFFCKEGKFLVGWCVYG